MMDSVQNSNNTLNNLSKGILIAFAIFLLISIYLLFTLPSDLRYKGDLQHLDLITPVLVKLYILLAITAGLAIVAIYLEMKKMKVAIVYKEKTNVQVEEERMQAETTNLDALDSKSIGTGSSSEILTSALNTLSKRLDGVAGACYICKEENGAHFAELVNGFALPLSESDVIRFNFGDGMVGQVAKSGSAIYIDDIPEGYFQVISGLGQASPKYILVLPIKKNNEVKGVLEVATFKSISNQGKQTAEKFAIEIGERLS
jgi:methyl-accepting chemotaxis protein